MEYRNMAYRKIDAPVSLSVLGSTPTGPFPASSANLGAFHMSMYRTFVDIVNLIKSTTDKSLVDHSRRSFTNASLLTINYLGNILLRRR